MNLNYYNFKLHFIYLILSIYSLVYDSLVQYILGSFIELIRDTSASQTNAEALIMLLFSYRINDLSIIFSNNKFITLSFS